MSVIVAAVKAQLETVSGVGIVFNRPRHTFDKAEFKSLFEDVTDNKYRVSFIDVIDSDPVEDDARFLFLRKRRVEVEHFFGPFIDAAAGETHTGFRNLVDLMLSKIDGNRTIFGSWPAETDETVRVTMGRQHFGKVLCHRALFDFLVESSEVKT